MNLCVGRCVKGESETRKGITRNDPKIITEFLSLGVTFSDGNDSEIIQLMRENQWHRALTVHYNQSITVKSLRMLVFPCPFWATCNLLLIYIFSIFS